MHAGKDAVILTPASPLMASSILCAVIKTAASDSEGQVIYVNLFFKGNAFLLISLALFAMDKALLKLPLEDKDLSVGTEEKGTNCCHTVMIFAQ